MYRSSFWSICLAIFFLTSVGYCVTPERALQMLLDGNRRFSSDQSIHPDRTRERRLETSEAQYPLAVILGCSDSRVAPEIIFDQGIGDLFIVRIAGNVVGSLELNSIHFAALCLNVPLILVLGHENCGAVKAVVEKKTQDIKDIASLIQPAVDNVQNSKGNLVENAIKENVALVVEHLKSNPALKKLIESKKIFINGGYYNFHSGQVEILNEIKMKNW